MANRGRQPTTLIEVAFLVDSEMTVEGKDGGPDIPVNAKLDLLEEGSVRLLGPGEVARFQMGITRLPHLVCADDPLRAFAVDSHGRTSWGGAAPLLRRLIDTKAFVPPPDTDPRLLERPDEPVVPTPVYPRWKLWQPRAMRAPLFKLGKTRLLRGGR